ncbi:DUF192 domain-containing protein [Rhizorhapis suberifaciens]|uniref:DUF192 domain-containing protein n=1 Tax=Rhizorhapis suberifaciens TaxID=13656 RepID=A0A840HVW6_9SPHN|nr:DUF192 domain-containing protein [Rhizorhapis suberifaciens]MBB4641821.1 hypothetical protein [Rhizorhapis suberifaciens]
MRLFLISLALLAACSADKPADKEPQRIMDESGTILLTIHSGAKVHRFQVELARTPDEQAKGLMFRKQLPPMGGMLFPFDPPQVASFWMKNTVIPLDMIFIRPDGTIAHIAANAEPYSLTPVSAGQMNSAVLEIAGGRAAELGIKEDDKVRWTAR